MAIADMDVMTDIDGPQAVDRLVADLAAGTSCENPPAPAGFHRPGPLSTRSRPRWPRSHRDKAVPVSSRPWLSRDRLRIVREVGGGMRASQGLDETGTALSR